MLACLDYQLLLSLNVKVADDTTSYVVKYRQFALVEIIMLLTSETPNFFRHLQLILKPQ